MSRQNLTNADDSEHLVLSPQQARAVDLLAIGKTVTQVSEEVGVARQTVSEWLNQHPGFQAALNLRRQELWAGMTDRLRALLPQAIEVLEKAIADGSVKTAVELLKATGIYGREAPQGPTNAEDAESAAKEQERARRDRAIFASLR